MSDPVTRTTVSVLLTLMLQFAVAANLPRIVNARIVGITDGDTVKALLPNNDQWKIRLAEIDTPEKQQPWSKRAKQALASKIFGKNVQIVVTGKDRYGRHIGIIYIGDRDINREMVREGHAWVYRKYMKDRSLLEAEQEARQAGRGLWSLPDTSRVPPWKWRSIKHHHNTHVAPSLIQDPRPVGHGTDIQYLTKKEE